MGLPYTWGCNIFHPRSPSFPPPFHWFQSSWSSIFKWFIDVFRGSWYTRVGDDAMTIEYSFLFKNNTCKLVSLPHGRNLVWCKWVYRSNYIVGGSIDKYKAHRVAKDFSHVEGIDYSKTFSPMVKMDSVHLVLNLTASQGWLVFQMDVKSTFYMMICMRRFIWSSLSILSRIPHLFVGL